MVEFADEVSDINALCRLAAGIRGRAPGRRVSRKISAGSLFSAKSTLDLLRDYFSVDLSGVRIDASLPLASVARLVHTHNPHMEMHTILADLNTARGRVYDNKYANRSTMQDERYLDYAAWQAELRGLLYQVGISSIAATRAIDVGIGNGNEAPIFFSEFASLIGVDVSVESLRSAKATMPYLKTMHACAEDLCSIDTASQDLYISLRTYQSSFFDIETACLEAGRVTTDRGVAVISIPHVYVESGTVARGLQHRGSLKLDPHLPWEIVDRVRRGLHAAEFECSVTTGLFEIYVIGRK